MCDNRHGFPDQTPNARILVLNRLWQAVNIVGVRRGFSLLFQDHARVILAEDGKFEVMDCAEWLVFSEENPPRRSADVIHTVRLSIRLPRVLLLSSYDRLPVKEIKFTRENIFKRDEFMCQYCGHKHRPTDLNLDHVIPRDRGGRTSWENIVTSCVRCNSRKANRLPHEAGMQLIRRPQQPKWRPFVSQVQEDEIDEAWAHFIHPKDVSSKSAT